jgi:hypothetical protein
VPRYSGRTLHRVWMKVAEEFRTHRVTDPPSPRPAEPRSIEMPVRAPAAPPNGLPSVVDLAPPNGSSNAMDPTGGSSSSPQAAIAKTRALPARMAPTPKRD